MLDIIEGDDIPLWRLCAATLQASAMLLLTVIRPDAAANADSF